MCKSGNIRLEDQPHFFPGEWFLRMQPFLHRVFFKKYLVTEAFLTKILDTQPC